MALVDKALIARKFAASAGTYRHTATAQRQIIGRLLELYRPYAGKALGRALEVGAGDASFAQAVQRLSPASGWTLNDIQADMLRGVELEVAPNVPVDLIIGDAESIDLGEGYDLILSSSALQWFHHPERFLPSLLGRLNPDGMVLLSTFGADNLREVRALTGKGLSYPSLEELRSWAEGFELLTLREERITLSFASPRDVLLHLRHTGVTASVEGEGFWTPRRYQSFLEAYQRLFPSEDGGVRLTYHPIYLVARRKA